MTQTVNSLLYQIDSLIINPLILLLFGVALIYFLWGVIKFIQHGDDPEARQIGGKHIMYGVIGMAIMMGVFGLVHIISSTLNVQPPSSISR